MQGAGLRGGFDARRGVHAGQPVLALESINGQGRLGRRQRAVGKRHFPVVAAGVAQAGRLEHNRRAAAGHVDRRVLRARRVGVDDVLARRVNRVQTPARLQALAGPGRQRADRASHFLDCVGDVLGLALLLLLVGKQRGAGVAAAFLHRPVRLRGLEVGAGGVVGAGLAGIGGVRSIDPIVELPVSVNDHALVGIHEVRPGAQRHRRHVRRVQELRAAAVSLR
jgi:hypothetical protein